MKLLFILLTVFNFAVKTPSDVPGKGGLDADFIINLKGATSGSLQHCTFEYKDGKKWKSAGPGLDIKKYSKKEIATLVQSFTVRKPSDSIRVRITCPDEAGKVSLQTGTWGKPQIVCYPGIKVKDTKRVAVVGNSFTFFYSSEFFLKRLSRLHGHQIEMSASLKGGQCLLQHTKLERTKDLLNSGYDVIILQDQSQAAAKLAAAPDENQSVLEGARELSGAFRKNSPKARIIYECTWSYVGKSGDFGGFGSFENFDRLLREGSIMVVEKTGDINEMSPVGQAFEAARAEGINLYYKDNKHQGQLGSYLKACVNFLLIYGEPFDEKLDLDCGLKHETAAALRKIATQTVLK